MEVYVEDFVKKITCAFFEDCSFIQPIKATEQRTTTKKCIFQELYFHIHSVTSLETSVLFPKSPLTWLKITSEHI